MAKYTDNNIQFNSIDVAISGNTKKWGQAELMGATDTDLVDIAADNGGRLPSIVNVVEVDWNGAELSYLPASGSRTINTTGELLSILINELKSLDSRCAILETGVQSISDSIEELENTLEETP